MNAIWLLSPMHSRGLCLERSKLSQSENPRTELPLQRNQKRVNTGSAPPLPP